VHWKPMTGRCSSCCSLASAGGATPSSETIMSAVRLLAVMHAIHSLGNDSLRKVLRRSGVTQTVKGPGAAPFAAPK
jgi:hypothetical protein